MMTVQQRQSHRAIKETTMGRLFAPEMVERLMRQAEQDLLVLALNMHVAALELSGLSQAAIQENIANRLPEWNERFWRISAVVDDLEPWQQDSEVEGLCLLLGAELMTWTDLSATNDPELIDLIRVWGE